MSNKKIDNANDNLVFVAQKPWLSVKEFAAYTGYKVSYVYKLISERRVPCYKRDGGKNVFFLKDEIDKWILGHRIAPMEELEEQAVRYVAKNSLQDVVFAPSKKVVKDIDDEEEDEQPKRKTKATTNKASAKKSKTKVKSESKTKNEIKKPTSKKSKDEDESPKKGKKTSEKTPTKTKKSTKKKK